MSVSELSLLVESVCYYADLLISITRNVVRVERFGSHISVPIPYASYGWLADDSPRPRPSKAARRVGTRCCGPVRTLVPGYMP